MVNFSKVVARIKGVVGVKNQEDLAPLFGLSPSDFSKRKKSGSLLPMIFDWAISNNVNLDWLFTGNGPSCSSVHADSDGTSSLPNSDLAMLITMTADILQSGTDYADSLAASIKSFYKSVRMERELSARDGPDMSINERICRLEKTFDEVLKRLEIGSACENKSAECFAKAASGGG